MKCFSVYANDLKGILSPLFFLSQPKNTKGFIGLNKIAEISPSRKINNLNLHDLVPYVGLPETDDMEIKEVLKRPYKEVKGRNIIKKGDILFSRIEPSIFNKKYILADSLQENEYAFTSTEFYIVKAKENVNPKFLFYMFFTKEVYAQVLGRTTGSTGRRRLDRGVFENLLIPYPDKQIQNKIVQLMENAHTLKKSKKSEAQKLLDSIDDYVLDELGIEMPELVDKQCYTIDYKGIERRFDPYYYQPKFKELQKALQKGKYKNEKLKKFISKIHYGLSIKNIYVDKGIPLLRILNLKPNKINLSDVVNLEESKRKEIGNGFVYAGDLLISRSGSIGIVAVVPKEADGFAFGSFMIKFCTNDKINKEFVSIWLNNKIAKLFTARERIGAIQGNITIETIENFNMPYPPSEIQSRIVEEVKRRMAEAERLKQEAQNLIEKARVKVEKLIIGK